MGYSFGIQGAMPGIGATNTTTPSMGGTPAANALNASAGLNPTQKQGLRALGAVKAGLSPSIDAYRAANPVSPPVAAAPVAHPAVAGILKSQQIAHDAITSLPPTGTTPNDPITNIPLSSVAAASKTPDTSTPGTLAPQAGDAPPTFPGLVGALANTSQNPNPQIAQITKQEQDLANEYGGALANASNGAGLADAQEARQSNLRQAEGAQMAGLAAAGATANTAQSNVQSGLNSAAGLAAPILGQYGQNNYGIGGNTSGGNLDPQTQAKSLAQKVMTNSMTYDQALSSLGYAGDVGTTFLNDAITAAGGNPLQLQSQGAGQQNVLQGIPALQSANTAAQGIGNTITSFLQQHPEVNSSPLAIGNAAQQWLQGKQLTDPTYQTLFNYLNEYTNTLAPILGVGGDATNLKTEIAQGFINANASGSSISQVLQSIGRLADDKVKNLQSGATGGGVTGGGSNDPLGIR